MNDTVTSETVKGRLVGGVEKLVQSLSPSLEESSEFAALAQILQFLRDATIKVFEESLKLTKFL